jgi:hypothetical protein
MATLLLAILAICAAAIEVNVYGGSITAGPDPYDVLNFYKGRGLLITGGPHNLIRLRAAEIQSIELRKTSVRELRLENGTFSGRLLSVGSNATIILSGGNYTSFRLEIVNATGGSVRIKNGTHHWNSTVVGVTPRCEPPICLVGNVLSGAKVSLGCSISRSKSPSRTDLIFRDLERSASPSSRTAGAGFASGTPSLTPSLGVSATLGASDTMSPPGVPRRLSRQRSASSGATQTHSIHAIQTATEPDMSSLTTTPAAGQGSYTASAQSEAPIEAPVTTGRAAPITVLPAVASTAVASTGSTAAALAGPGGASQASRAQAALSMIACDPPDVNADPEVAEYPARIAVGGNSLAGAVLIATGALLALQIASYASYRTGVQTSFATGSGWVAFVASYAGPIVFGFYAPLLARDGISLALHGNGIVCLIGLGCSIMLVACAVHLTTRVLLWAEMKIETRTLLPDGTVKITSRAPEHTSQNGASMSEYVDSGERPFLAQYGAYVAGCKNYDQARFRCYAAVETWAGITVGILDGARPQVGSCAGYAYGILGISLACALYHITMKPLGSRLEQRFAWFRAFLECSVAGLVCASFWRSIFGAWAGWGAVVLCAVFPIELVVGAVVWWRERQKRKRFEGGAISTLIPPGPGALPPKSVCAGVSSYDEEPLLAIPVANPLNA